MRYIIDAPSSLYDIHGTLRVPVKVGEGDLCWYNTYLKVESYTEPDRTQIEDEVWEFATICTKMDGADSVDVFGGFSLDSFTKYSYQEAKAKYEVWLKHKDGIHVGDEVENASHKKGIVFNHCISPSSGLKYVRVLYMDDDGNSFISAWEKNDVKKTGRHFAEVAELLKKMRGNEEE